MPASPAIRATVGTGEAPIRPRRRLSSAARPTMIGESPARPTSMSVSVRSGGRSVCSAVATLARAAAESVLAGLVAQGALVLGDQRPGDLVVDEHGPIVRL